MYCLCIRGREQSELNRTELCVCAHALTRRLPSGEFTVRFGAPPAAGGNVVAGTFLYGSNITTGPVWTAANATTVTVPGGGLATMTVSWSFPSTLSTGNWGDLTLSSLNTVDTEGEGDEAVRPHASMRTRPSVTTCSHCWHAFLARSAEVHSSPLFACEHFVRVYVGICMRVTCSLPQRSCYPQPPQPPRS